MDRGGRLPSDHLRSDERRDCGLAVGLGVDISLGSPICNLSDPYRVHRNTRNIHYEFWDVFLKIPGDKESEVLNLFTETRIQYLPQPPLDLIRHHDRHTVDSHYPVHILQMGGGPKLIQPLL